MLTSLSSFFHFYTISSVPANVGAGVSSCEGDCGSCRGGGANYFDCEGHSLVSVVMVELWWLCSWVMTLKRRSSVLPQQHVVLWWSCKIRQSAIAAVVDCI